MRHGRRRRLEVEPTRVEGPICESTDALGVHDLPPLRRGDLVAIARRRRLRRLAGLDLQRPAARAAGLPRPDGVRPPGAQGTPLTRRRPSILPAMRRLVPSCSPACSSRCRWRPSRAPRPRRRRDDATARTAVSRSRSTARPCTTTPGSSGRRRSPRPRRSSTPSRRRPRPRSSSTPRPSGATTSRPRKPRPTPPR